MPDSMMTLFPQAETCLKGLQASFEIGSSMLEAGKRNLNDGFTGLQPFLKTETELQTLEDMKKNTEALMGLIQQDSLGSAEFLRLFTDKPAVQDWSFGYQDKDILLDLPGLRLIDISSNVKHKIKNYTVVFAPRAGHHSNIAERTALFLREKGLTRMAVVEQKCASDVPLYVNGERHHENFDGQVEQYKAVLERLKEAAGGFPSHLIAVCQPGPLLAATLILNPSLGMTFGSAGSPMDTEGEKGFLTDFSRLMGEHYIDFLLNAFYRKVPRGETGEGRLIYDGRLQVLGFYMLGMAQHIKNFRKAFSDIQKGETDAFLRQKHFYEWYNNVNHFPAGFIRDTYKKIFVNNQLIKGTLEINGKPVGIRNYPADVPIWALGGTNDDIAPPLQATGHVSQIPSVPKKDRLVLLAEAGHMGLFRSRKVLNSEYGKIARFLLKRSNH